MDILLSWSGGASHDIALSLREWLPEVIPGCAPWVSSEDIAKGKRWSDELHAFLAKASVAVVCVTPANVTSPWLYYEAGFIAAKLGEASVCPFLVGVEGKLVQGTPLGQYQWTEAEKGDALKLIRTLNDRLPTPHHVGMLEGNYRARWTQLERRLVKAVSNFNAISTPVTNTAIPLSDTLSPEAKELLIKACGEGSQQGDIMYILDMEGDHFYAGGVQISEPMSAREVAAWRGGLADLIRAGLVTPPPPDGGLAEVTREGWKVYDQLATSVPDANS